MSDTVASLIQKLQEQRRFWVTLSEEPTRKVQVTRPTAAQMAMFQGLQGMARFQAFADLVDDWKGFSLVDLGGDAPDRVPFNRAAWDALWVDRLDWLATVFEAANNAFVKHQGQKADAEKN